MTANDKHCNTECREELLQKIHGCALKSGVWKFVAILVTISIFLWGVGYNIHAGGETKTEWRLKESENKIANNTVTIAKITTTLDALTKGQSELNTKLDNLTAVLLKEIKRSR